MHLTTLIYYCVLIHVDFAENKNHTIESTIYQYPVKISDNAIKIVVLFKR